MKYELTNVQASIDQNTGGQWQDQYGNLSWNCFAKDEQSQVYPFLKRTKQGNPPPKIGDVLEGEMKEETGKSGKPYWRFYPEKKWSVGGGREQDQDSINLSYAKDIIIALINKSTKITNENITADLETMALFVKELYQKMKAGQITQIKDKVVSSETPPSHTDEEIDIEDIDVT